MKLDPNQSTLLGGAWGGEPSTVFPPVDKHGNVYWLECQEPGCTWRTKPYAKDDAQGRGDEADAHSLKPLEGWTYCIFGYCPKPR